MDKNDIDKEAEAEAEALNKAGRHKPSRRIRFETGSYNEIILDRLFVVDKLHQRRENK